MFLTSMELFNLWKGCKGVCVREVCVPVLYMLRSQSGGEETNVCVEKEINLLVGRHPFHPLIQTGTVKRSRGLAK